MIDKIDALLQQRPALNHLLKQAEQEKRLLATIQALLPDDLKPHCAYVRLKKDELILYADSPIWASRLRFYLPQLTQYLPVPNIRVKVLKCLHGQI